MLTHENDDIVELNATGMLFPISSDCGADEVELIANKSCDTPSLLSSIGEWHQIDLLANNLFDQLKTTSNACTSMKCFDVGTRYRKQNSIA